ncbi:hypothetical protein BRD04_03095 [Halobacteriales archaeon QS_9_67_17]|nr:MAG: hypothetical protein BRD04_03095 [Halobacteriales archaeon QS_9_67_17]
MTRLVGRAGDDLQRPRLIAPNGLGRVVGRGETRDLLAVGERLRNPDRRGDGRPVGRDRQRGHRRFLPPCADRTDDSLGRERVRQFHTWCRSPAGKTVTTAV